MTRLHGVLDEARAAFAPVLRNPDLRRLQLAFACSTLGSWAYGVALAVYAFEQAGPMGAGVALFSQMLPSAVAAPLLAALGDRGRRERVMIVSDWVRAAGCAGAALLIALGPPLAAVLVVAGVIAVAGTAFQPASRALLPSLVQRPEELTAANVVATGIGNASSLAGPALGGLLLATAGVEAVFAVCGATFVASALLVAGIAGGPALGPTEPRGSVLRELGDGLGAIASYAHTRLVVGCFAMQTLVGGMLNVFVLVIALENLHAGRSAVGFLLAAIGAGGVLGALAGGALVAQSGMGRALFRALVLWGAPIALLPVLDVPVAVVALLVLVGVADTLVDVCVVTLLQRTTPEAVIGRVFGVLETVLFAMGAAGGIAAPVLMDVAGSAAAMVIAGVGLALTAAVARRPLRRLDASFAEPAVEVQVAR